MIETSDRRTDRRKRLLRVGEIAVSVAVVVVVFAGVVPRFADYSAVWATIRSLTWFEVVTLCAATVLQFCAIWPQLVASLPGLTLAQAAVNGQASSAVANALPGGGVIAVGASYAMYRSWGFPDSAIALSTLITFVWNIFMRLGLPVIALFILVADGKGSGGLIVASLVGVTVLVAAITLFALALWKQGLAGRLGVVAGLVASSFRKLFRKPPVSAWGEVAVRFHGEAIRVVVAGWLPLTVATVVSHLGLYVVLVLALRAVGVSAQEVTWAQALGVFAVVRLLSALPITPGGLGVVDLGYIAGLVLAGRGHAAVPIPVFQAEVTAAVLVFRALTYGLQLPLGMIAYFIWQHRRSWRKAVPGRVPVAPSSAAPVSSSERPERNPRPRGATPARSRLGWRRP